MLEFVRKIYFARLLVKPCPGMRLRAVRTTHQAANFDLGEQNSEFYSHVGPIDTPPELYHPNLRVHVSLNLHAAIGFLVNYAKIRVFLGTIAFE